MKDTELPAVSGGDERKQMDKRDGIGTSGTGDKEPIIFTEKSSIFQAGLEVGTEIAHDAPFVKMKNAGGRDRTADTRLMSPLLYQLSYPGTLCFKKGKTDKTMRIRGRILTQSPKIAKGH